MVVIRDGSSVVVRYIYVDRNRGQRIEMRYRVSPSGDVIASERRTIGTDGVAGEPTFRYEVAGDSARVTGPSANGPFTRVTKAEPGQFFRTGGIPFDDALLAQFLLRQPDRTAKLLPQGRARLEIIADTALSLGGTRQRLRLAMIHTQGSNPSGVWLDERGGFAASTVEWFMAIRPGMESAMPTLRAIEMAWRMKQAEALSQRLTKPANGPIVIRNGDVFDSERGVVMPRTTVVIRGDRIEAVGPADAIATPAGATVIDATGKTVLPGLWDMHTHFQANSASGGTLMQLATGITAIRDLAADTDVGVAIRDRANAGRVVSPRVYLAGIIEGPGAWAGPTDVIVHNEAEARALVAMYDSLGFKQIKLYNLVHPDFLPTIAAEAHKRGTAIERTRSAGHERDRGGQPGFRRDQPRGVPVFHVFPGLTLLAYHARLFGGGQRSCTELQRRLTGDDELDQSPEEQGNGD
jgi:hypothetical protein